jgi:hypothetical protein
MEKNDITELTLCLHPTLCLAMNIGFDNFKLLMSNDVEIKKP